VRFSFDATGLSTTEKGRKQTLFIGQRDEARRKFQGSLYLPRHSLSSYAVLRWFDTFSQFPKVGAAAVFLSPPENMFTIDQSLG
jgi:predicted alpha/beta hydrolase family esterase